MSDYINDLVSSIYDPQSLQLKTLEMLKQQYNGDLDLPDASNPFVFLLENSCMLANASAVETTNIIRKVFPTLANDMDDLYPHIRPNEIDNLFGKPSSAWFNITIKVDDIERYGIKRSTYIELNIPELTKFVVADKYTFINVKPIKIKMLSRNKIFVLEEASSLDFFDKRNKQLESVITTDANNVTWLNITVELKQLDYQILRDYISTSSPFYLEIPLNNMYFYGSVIKVNDMPINIGFSPFYFDKDVPTVLIRLSDTSVKYHIPDYYLINNKVQGNIEILQMVTLGPISDAITSYTYQDVKIIYPTDNLTIKNVAMWAKPVTNPYGGSLPIGFTELKEKIITHTTGDNLLPVTYEELNERLSTYNLEVVGRDESITNRYIYADFKDITNENYAVTPDILTGKFILNYEQIDNYRIVKYDNSYIINPFNVFKYDGSLVVDRDVEQIDTQDKLAEYLETNNVFYNIHKYVIDVDEPLRVRIYDIINPKVENILETVNNIYSEVNFIIDTDSVSRTRDNYYINLIIKPDNDKFVPNLKLAYYIPDSNFFINNITVTYDDINKVYTASIPIETTGYITSDHAYISSLYNIASREIPIEHEGIVYIYTEDSNFLPDYNIQDITLFNSSEVILSKNTLDVKLATYLKYLNSDISITYTDRKYKRYEEDVPLVYTENVYEMDENGVVVNYIDTDGDGVPDTAEPVILHKKGDVVVDSDGNIVYKYRAGDIMLDETGEPIIDTDIGIVLTLDILIFEYVFKLANQPEYKDYLYSIYDMITEYSTEILEELNEDLLENTSLILRPKNNPNNITLISNTISLTMPNFITVSVELYLNDNVSSEVSTDIDNKIKYIVQKSLLNNVSKYEIEDTIAEELGDIVVGVNLDLPDTLSKFKQYETDKKSSRILIKKRLGYYNNYIIPDLSINITKTTV